MAQDLHLHILCHIGLVMKEFPFVGRVNELKSLVDLTQKRSSSLIVIRGKRRVGKSRLVEEFAKNYRFLRFAGLSPTE